MNIIVNDNYECTGILSREDIKAGRYPECGSPSIVSQVRNLIDCCTSTSTSETPIGETSIFIRY